MKTDTKRHISENRGMSGRDGKKIGVISLGCSKNLVNSEQMMFLLKQAGYDVSGDTETADIVLINTCGFIESAKTEAIETILEIAATKEEGRVEHIVVAGCLPQRYKDDILNELPEIDAVVGTGSFDEIVEVLDSLRSSGSEKKTVKLFGDINAPISETDRIITTSASWAYLKIAEGCDNRCAYCCIPDIRGRFRSRPIGNIIEEAKKLVDRGTRELIIVAQDVTNYGTDLYGRYMLVDLLKELNSLENLEWIRLHYLYPDKIDDELIDVIAKSGKILKYLDIPIQHIADNVLKKMLRQGSGKNIRELFKRIREQIPGVVLRTSFITGLPGEGEKEFAELLEFLHEMKIERAGVFTYSPEEGTKAALMDRPSKEVAELRAAELSELQAEIMYKWNESRIGSVETVLPEDFALDSQQSHFILARSFAESPDVDDYIYIRMPQNEVEQSPCAVEANSFIDVRIIGFENGNLVGERK